MKKTGPLQRNRDHTAETSLPAAVAMDESALTPAAPVKHFQSLAYQIAFTGNTGPDSIS
jgi:hypothetical protein